MGAERDAALTYCVSVVQREGKKTEGEQSAGTNHTEEDKNGAPVNPYIL